MGAHVGTFADLHAEILALAGTPLPVALDPIVHRLAVSAIDAAAKRGALLHYGSIQHKPGLAQALTRLVAELKRARVDPLAFQNAVKGRGQRLEELAELYNEYQNSLIQLGWADVEGLGWLAVQALQDNASLSSRWKLVIADGFDILYPTQLETLKLLSEQVGDIILTLTGDRAMERTAYRRFKRTLHRITEALNPQIESGQLGALPTAPLAHLARSIFESDAPKVSPGQELSLVEAQTPALEAREALRWIKARCTRDGVEFQSCAIIARDISPYRPYLREAGIEFGMPLYFAQGEPLITNPLVSTILNVLELSLTGWRRRGLLGALRSPYLNLAGFDLSHDDAFRFDIVAHWGHIVQGLEQWKDSFDRLIAQKVEFAPTEDEEESQNHAPVLPQGLEAGRMWDSLSRFIEHVSPPASGSITSYVTWLENLLSSEQGFAVDVQAEAQKETANRDRSALASFKDILRALCLSEKIVGERDQIPYREFYADLRAAVEGETFSVQDLRDQSSVLCASLAQARGVSFRAVALLGLSEGIFPAQVEQDPFLPEGDRVLLGAQGLAIEERLRSDQQSLFYEAVTRARDFLLLTRPYLADDGEPWLESPYWNAVRALYVLDPPERVRTETARALADCASRVELMTAAVQQRNLPSAYSVFAPTWERLRYAGSVLSARLKRDYHGPFDGEVASLSDVLKTQYGPARTWSASKLETFAQCGFRFFLGDTCKLEAIETPEDGYDAAQLGSMLHAILEQVYQRALDPTSLEELLTLLPEVANQVFDGAPAKYGFRPSPLWDQQRQELIPVLRQTISRLSEEESGFRPIRFELRFGDPALTVDTPAGKISFRGMIDRIDVDAEKNLRVIDYKTGGITKYTNSSLEKGLHLQLVLYALSAEKTLNLGRVADAFYWGILAGKGSSLHLGKFESKDPDKQNFSGFAGATALATEHIGAYIDKIRRGVFTPIPPETKCPDYCVAKTICWRYEASEHR